MVKEATERGAMVITAMAFGIFDEPWAGMLIGLVAILALCGWRVFIPEHSIQEFGPIDEHAKEPETPAVKKEEKELAAEV